MGDHDLHWKVGAGLACVATAALYRWAFHLDGAVPSVDEKKHGGDLVGEALKAHGVTHVFTLCGGHVSTILIGCKKRGIKVIDTRHEVTAVFAADAMSRLTGVPGVAVVTAGPGVTNTVTAVKNAQLAQSPLVVMGGAAATLLKNRGALQDVDQLSLFRSICKWTASVDRVADIIPTVNKAFQMARSGVPGPVFIEFPIDTLYPIDAVMDEYISKKTGKGLMAQIVAWYLQRHVNRLYAGAFEPKPTKPLPVSWPRHSSSDVKRAADLLKQAKRPVLLVGSQSMLLSDKADAIARAVNSIGAPTYLAGMARGLLGTKSPVWVRQKRSQALKEADLVILAGVPCDFRLNYGRTLSRKSKIVAINRSKEELTKNQDLFWKSNVTVHGDPGSFLLALATQTQSSWHSNWCDWLQKLRKVDEDKDKENKKKAMAQVDKNMNPVEVAFALEDVLPDNSILVADGGDFVGTAAYVVRPRAPLNWLDPGVFGTLGVGAGFALAAKLANPDAQVWIIFGDGSVGYSLSEFDTFARFGIPVIALVGNDACWSQIARDQIQRFKEDVGCMLSDTAYHKVAEAFGGKGLELKGRASPDEMRAVLKQAQKLATGPDAKPVLVNMHIGKSDFREGSISV